MLMDASSTERHEALPSTPAQVDRFDWVVFKPGERRQAALAVFMTINKTGRISLSKKAAALLAPAKSVDLLFDLERRIIGLRPSEADTAYALQRGSYVEARAFVEHYEIPWRSMRFDAFMAEGALCIAVADPGEHVGAGRPREMYQR